VTKNRFLLLGLMLTILIIIGVTLISSNSPFPSTISPESESPLNTASPAPTPSIPTPSIPTPSAVQNERPSIEPEDLVAQLREAGVTALGVETYTEGPYKGPKGSLMDIFSHRTFYTSNIGIGSGLLNDSTCCHSIVIYHFDDRAIAERYAATLSTEVPPNTYAEANVSWSAEARFYLADSSIVGYVGGDITIIEELDSTLGKPFIVGDTIYRLNMAKIELSEPITISSDFILRKDYIFRDNGFIIAADNITIDLNGHTILGQGKGDGILVEGRKGVTIKNGVISRFTNAIRLSESDGNVIQNITFLGGIVIDGDHNEVSRNKMREYGVGTTTQPPFRNSVGITINGSNNKVLNNNVTSTGEYIVGVHGNNNEISSNMIDIGGNFKVGPTVVFINGSQNVLTANTIRGETRISGLGNIFSNNLAEGKVILDGANESILSDNGGSGSGFTLSIELGSENRIFNNRGFEISILAGSQNVVQNNEIGGGIYGPGVTIRSDGNEFSGNSVTYVHDDPSSDGPVQERIIIDISGNDNMVTGNTIKGTLVVTGGNNIMVMNNFMFQWNQFHARDDGMNNIWHRDGKGNYWDGISDSPYVIPGKAGATDRFPLNAPYRPE